MNKTEDYQITGFKDGVITVQTPDGEIEVSARLAANAQSLLDGCKLASNVASRCALSRKTWESSK